MTASGQVPPSAGAAAPDGSGDEPHPPLVPPWRRRPAMVVLLVGAMLVVLLIPLLKSAFTTPAPAPQHAATARATSPGPATGPSAAPKPTRAERWRAGLAALRRRMDSAIRAGLVTRGSLRYEASALSRCSAGLAAFGPPPTSLRPAYRLARKACAAFRQGAADAAAAARDYAATGTDGRLMELLNRGDDAVNHGIGLIGRASLAAAGT